MAQLQTEALEQAGDRLRPHLEAVPLAELCGEPAPDPRSWSSIRDPAERTRTALRETYAFYSSTEPMYVRLLRDEPLMPAVQRRLRDFYGYLRSIQEQLAAGRRLRGRRAQYVRAAIGHALSFPTWRSLTHDQGLSNDDAVELMSRLVEDAASSGRVVGRASAQRYLDAPVRLSARAIAPRTPARPPSAGGAM